jgi:hypothetical protein
VKAMTTVEEFHELKVLVRLGNDRKLLGKAAKLRFPKKVRVRIQRGWSAMLNPNIYKQMGENPDDLVADGLRTIKEYLK